MARIYTNFASSTLASGITNVATSLTVASGDGALFPAAGSGNTFDAVIYNTSLQREVISCTSRTGDVLTIVRAQQGTTALAWNAGDKIGHRLTKDALNNILFAENMQQNTPTWCGTAGGTANALTLTPSPAVTAMVAGHRFIFKAGASANTTAATMAVSGLATFNLQNNGNALLAGDIEANKWYEVLYDGTNGQLSRFSVDIKSSSGTSQVTVNTVIPKLQITGGSDANSASLLGNWAADSVGAYAYFIKSRNTTVGSHTVVQSGDLIGAHRAFASDGTGYIEAASIHFGVSTTPGTNDMPGYIAFNTTADGAASPTERMRLSHNGQLSLLTGDFTTGGATNLTIATSGGTQLRVSHIASAVNFITINGNATAGSPYVSSANSSDTNVGPILVGKGTGAIGFYHNAAGAQPSLSVSTSAGTVANFAQFSAVATGSGPTLAFTGSDANVGAIYSNKGSIAQYFYGYGASYGATLVLIPAVSSVNWFEMVAGTTGNSTNMWVNGSDSNTSPAFINKGVGSPSFYANAAGGQASFSIASPSGTVANALQATSATTGNSTQLGVVGTDSNINLYLTSKGTGVIQVNQTGTNSSGAFLVIPSHATTPYGQQIYFSVATPDNNTQWFLYCADATTARCIIYSDGDLQNHDNSYGAISDARLKQDIVDAKSQWNDVKNLRVRKYKFRSDVAAYGAAAVEHIGFVAQEVLPISPGLVQTGKDGHYSLQYSVANLKLFKAFQEAQGRIEALEAEVELLKKAA